MRTGQQVGFVRLIGILTKAELVDARQQVNRLAEDPGVGEILVLVDSPGGTVAGTHDLYLAISRATELKKVTGYIEDIATSGAIYAIAGASEIIINPTGITGSIGVYVVLVDASKQFERDGIEVIVIRSGTGKGAGVSGAKISPEQLEQLQERVNEQARHFVAAIARGRKMSTKKALALADGRTFIGSQAVAAGLVDRVAILEDVVAAIGERTAGLEFAHLAGHDARFKFNELVAARVAAGDTESWARHVVAQEHRQLAAIATKQFPRSAAA